MKNKTEYEILSEINDRQKRKNNIDRFKAIGRIIILIICIYILLKMFGQI